jgi:mono/diheme cytochrome c family protein
MRRRSGRVCLICFLSAASLLLAGCSQMGLGLSGAELRGQELFDLHCADCHEESNPDLKKQPPKLKGLFRSKLLPSGAPATDLQVRKTIIDGLGTMPAFDQRLSDQDVDDLVKYLHALK